MINLNEFKKKYKMTSNDIAKFCGCSRQAVSTWLLRGTATNKFGFDGKIEYADEVLSKEKIKYKGQALDILLHREECL